MNNIDDDDYPFGGSLIPRTPPKKKIQRRLTPGFRPTPEKEYFDINTAFVETPAQQENLPIPQIIAKEHTIALSNESPIREIERNRDRKTIQYPKQIKPKIKQQVDQDEYGLILFILFLGTIFAIIYLGSKNGYLSDTLQIMVEWIRDIWEKNVSDTRIGGVI